jgi:hypothetical protein
MLGRQMGNIGDSITNAYAAQHADVAIQVEVENARRRANELAARVAQEMTATQAATTKVTELQARLDRAKQAGRQAKAAVDAAGDDAAQREVAQGMLQTCFKTMTEIGGAEAPYDGSVSGTLFEAKQAVATQKNNQTFWQEEHRKAVEEATHMEERASHAAEVLARAKQEQKTAEDQRRQAEADANLAKSSGSHVGLDAMEAAAREAQEKATAARLQAEAVRNVSGSASSADAVFDKLLAKPTPDAHTAAMDAFSNL